MNYPSNFQIKTLFQDKLGYQLINRETEDIPSEVRTILERQPDTNIMYGNLIKKPNVTHYDFHLIVIDYFRNSFTKFKIYVDNGTSEYTMSLNYNPVELKIALSTYMENFEVLNSLL